MKDEYLRICCWEFDQNMAVSKVSVKGKHFVQCFCGIKTTEYPTRILAQNAWNAGAVAQSLKYCPRCNRNDDIEIYRHNSRCTSIACNFCGSGIRAVSTQKAIIKWQEDLIRS